MTKPEFLFLDVNKACNLKCIHCNFHTRKDDFEAFINEESIFDLLSEFKAIARTNPKLVICGGEPMLNMGRYLRLPRDARSLGIRVLSVVHGGQIKDSNIESICADGPDEISISFDDFRESEHNYMRGNSAAYSLAMRGLKLLLEHSRNRSINVMALVHAGNYLELPRWYQWAKDLGVHKLKLNFIQPTFGGTQKPDEFFQRYGSMDADMLSDILDQCEIEFGVKYKTEWRTAVYEYVAKISLANRALQNWNIILDEPLCNSYDRNIMVDADGYMSFCFSTCSGSKKRWNNSGDLQGFWESSQPRRDSLAASGCHRVCGISHSVRKVKCYETY